MKLETHLDHAAALNIYTDAGYPFPRIPPPANTVYHHFEVDGDPAVIINQTGFQRLPTDNEEEVNGCIVIIARHYKPGGKAGAVDFLERYVREMLEI